MKHLVATSFVAACLIMPVFAAQESELPSPSLKALAKQSNIYVGAAMETRHLKEPEFALTFASQFNQLTPENEMKWSYIHPERDRFDFTKGDELVAFAEKHGMEVKGHALVWHIQNPDWLTEQEWTPSELVKVLENHIKTVVGHYKGKVKYWDVVNESFNENGSYRETLWYEVLGERYLELAFKFAHEADPDAILFYNDYGNEGMGPKSNAIYRKMKAMVDDGVPIHGVGFQLHLMGEHTIGEASVARNIERLKDLGLKIHFTEIDVRIRDDAKPFTVGNQARLFSRLMDFAIYYPEVDMYTTWGVTDKYSWIPGWFPGYGRGLMFDENYQPKKAFDAVYSSLLAASQGEFAYEPPIGDNATSRIVQPFVANPLDQASIVDEQVIYYPFAYNQLGGQSQAVPDAANLSGKWAMGYFGNKLIGRVHRQDDQTFTNKSLVHENDNVEVFISVGETYWQIRSIVGQDFAANNFPGSTKGIWSEDGKVFDFEIEFTELKSLTGETIGFNIALSDNDESGADATRHAQMYPLPGNNTAWKGEQFGELFMIGQNAVLPTKPVATPAPFKVMPLASRPDSSVSEVWKQAMEYSLEYNQLNSADQTISDRDDISGSWQLGYHKNWMFGVVNRIDDVTVTNMEHSYQNDNVEVFFGHDENTFYQLRTTVGEDFESSSYPYKHFAKWNADNTKLFFGIELREAPKAGVGLNWNIALSDNDKDQRKTQIYPVPGNNRSYMGEELTRVEFQ